MMVTHLYRCEECEAEKDVSCPISQAPPGTAWCEECEDMTMRKVWRPVQFICDASDPDHIPMESRVTENTLHGVSKSAGTKKEAAYRRALDKRRRQLADGGNQGTRKHTHSVPAELYHGKIKQTGDKDYWKDPANLNKHKDCRVG